MNRFSALARPAINGLHPYVPGKPISELERELGITDSIKLASNENPLGPSPLGMAAAAEAVRGINIYPDDSAFRLRHALGARYGVSPESILVGSGSSDVIDMVARVFLGPGCNAVFSQHAFAMYPIYTQAVGAQSKVARPLPPDHPQMPYGHDLTAMAEQVDAETRVVFIANPNNPTGTWLQRDDLIHFLDGLPGHVIVVLDEAYTEYVNEEGFPDGVELLANYPNLIVTRTFSKIYGLAGLRVGYGIADPDLIALIGRVRHPFNVNSPALAAAEAALADSGFIDRSVEVNRQGLVQLQQGFQALGLPFIPSVANFMTVDLLRSAAEVNQALLREGVVVRPVANYSMPNHLRITIGTAAENERCLKALQKVLGK
jgi:histidinol-phosphate aminotransferase